MAYYIDRDQLICTLQTANMFGHNADIPAHVWKHIYSAPEHISCWIREQGAPSIDGFDVYKCVECGYDDIYPEHNYCPNCGARMTNRLIPVSGGE